jgi:hypothetical protein
MTNYQNNSSDPHYREDKEAQRETLQKLMDQFLEKGGKIEKLPACMTSDEYKNLKAIKTANRKKGKK